MTSIPQEFRILPRAIDYKASICPNDTYVILPKGNRIADGFKPLTWYQYAKAINEIAWWLDDWLDGPVKGEEIPTVAYVGPNDVRYSMMIMAASKTKRQTMLPFPANTVTSQTNLLRNSKCRYVVFGSHPSQDWVDTLAQLPDIKSVQLPEVATFLHERPVESYEFPKSLEEAYDDPIYTIQTSGTTGNPKPIVITNRNDIEHLDMHELNQRQSSDSKLVIQDLFEDSYLPLLLPYSWIAGIVPLLRFPLNSNTTPVLMPSTMPQPMTAAYLREAIISMPKGRKNGIFVTPDTLREAARDKTVLAEFSAIDWVGYVGAPLDHETGDLISEHVRVQSMIGSTDTGIYPILKNDPKDWKINRFLPIAGWHLEQYADDTFELCIYREPNDPRHCFRMDPDCTNYHTKDLFRAVPGREGFYTNAGRIDDFIKLSTMTKFNATAIEQIINQHPKVRKSFVGGDARERTFAIVEPKEYGDRTADEILDELWPAFEEANKLVFGEAQLIRRLVLVTDPKLPIKQTAKGSVERRTTMMRYEGKIEAMFKASGFQSLPEGADSNIV